MPSPDDAPPRLLLVGASRGLGAAMAAEFAKRCWRVVGTVRREVAGPLETLARQGDGALALERLDVTRTAEVRALRERLAGQRFDMLFVNAGTVNRDPAATLAGISAEEFAEVMLTNAFGVLQTIEALDDLVADDGLIGAMSSGQGSIANNVNGRNDLYRASKAALNQLMKSYAGRSAAGRRALVLMAPGWIRTALGGPGAPVGVEEAVPQIVETLLRQRGRPGLQFIDRDGREVPW